MKLGTQTGSLINRKKASSLGVRFGVREKLHDYSF